MKWAALVLAALVAVAAADTVVLDADNFDTKTASGEWLIKFYAPWCGHCKKLAPTWDELATSKKGDFNVGKIDCTGDGNKDVCSKFGVRGYPTVKFIKDGGDAIDYRGQRTIDAFTSFVEEQRGNKKTETPKAADTGAAAAAGSEGDVVVLTDATFADKTASGTWLIKFYAPWCGHCKKLAPVWDELATATKGTYNIAKVDCTTDKDVCSKFGVRGYPTVKLFKDGGEPVDYRGAREVDAFKTFLAEN